MNPNQLFVPKGSSLNRRSSLSPFLSNQSPIPLINSERSSQLNLSRVGSLSRIGGSIASSPTPQPHDINSITLKKIAHNSSRSLNSFDYITILDTFQSSQASPVYEPTHSNQILKAAPRNRTIIFDKHPAPLLNVGYGISEKINSDLNSLYRSSHYIKKQQTIPPPRDKINSIFSIYYLGRGFNVSGSTLGRSNGLGILLSPDLCLTTHSVIADEDAALNSYAQFRNSEVFKFDPQRCFVTSSNHEFTLVAFQSQSAFALQLYKPINITEPFSLRIGDSVTFFPYDSQTTKKVLAIENNLFTFTSGNKEGLLPGTPIFSSTWIFQGIYIRCSSHINIVNRVEHVFDYFESFMSMNPNSLLDRFLHLDHIGFMKQFHDMNLYYFEWHGRSTWKYDIGLNEWVRINLGSIESLEKKGKHWTYHWNSRLVYLPDMSILIIGGKSKLTGGETNELWLLSPSKGYKLKKLASMSAVRESAACVYIEKSVYVIGGKPNLQSCEMLSLNSKKWTDIASMQHPRYDAAACSGLNNTHIFVFGGCPVSTSGRSIEIYSIKKNQWDLLPISMPKPLLKPALFPITDRKIAILGGGSSSIYLLYIEDSLDQQDYKYKLKECIKNLEENLETAWPVAYDRDENKLYILNLNRSGYISTNPGVVEYRIQDFEFGQRQDHNFDLFSTFGTSKQSRVQTPISLHR
ncbi:unnamed protein product [Blepharisma stoltei]|uniref:Uncharacterized protein n=1 Tax=Blepharisma stoltei TaxID=1481888 RepID=A0AAU9K9J1_9CILI|nr:unnamed protein product [Blepharisma stoltei]